MLTYIFFLSLSLTCDTSILNRQIFQYQLHADIQKSNTLLLVLQITMSVLDLHQVVECCVDTTALWALSANYHKVSLLFVYHARSGNNSDDQLRGKAKHCFSLWQSTNVN